MIPFLGPLLAGRGLKIGVAALSVAALFGAGFKKGLDWRAGQLEAAREKTGQAIERAERSEADYTQLRQQVADAMRAGQERAIELEKQHAEASKRAAAGYEKRIAGVLDIHKRLLGTVAASGGRGSPAELPELPSPRCSNDSSAERELVERIREADFAEARLIELQNLIRSQ